MNQEPTIGRIVHYVIDDIMDKHRPAIIIECGGSVVDLQIFTTEGMVWRSDVEQDEDFKSDCTWHWPERTE